MKIGIDFGTTFSLPAGFIDGARFLLLLPSNMGGIPSVFYYDKEVGIQIGTAADENAVFYPNNVKRDIKMEISTQADSFIADGKTFSKKEIIGHIFKEIAHIAEEEMEKSGLVDQTIDGVVISVPAAFTLRELNIIRDAAQSPVSDGGAGLEVWALIREPAAAAISYFNAPNAEDKKTILVYDLGGGTCDIAIVRSDKDSREWYTVIDSDMKRIGGRDWDGILIEMIKERYCQVAGDIHFDAEVEDKIRRIAIQTKHILSRQNAAHASVNISGQVHRCTITVEQFERATSELLQSTMSLVDDLVKKCKTSIDYIVCVGGSSNMPQIRRAFADTYPGIPVKLHEPEKAIAFGAAFYAAQLTEPNPEPNPEPTLEDLTEVIVESCKFSYGVKVIADFNKYHDKTRLRIRNIIKKGSRLTASGTRPFRWQEELSDAEVAIYESECTDDVYSPEKGVHIGQILIARTKDTKKDDIFDLTINIDTSGLMLVEAKDRRSGKLETTKIQLIDF